MSPNPAVLTWPRRTGTTVFAYDTFTRADSTTLGYLESGQAWGGTALASFGISGGKLYRHTSVNTYECVTINVGSVSYTVAATMSALPTGQGALLTGLFASATNYVGLRVMEGGAVRLEKRQAGTFTTVGSGVSVAAGDVLSLNRNGNVYAASKNGTPIYGPIEITHAESANTTAGIGGPDINGQYRWDDFEVTV